jgi:hypothetical protein
MSSFGQDSKWLEAKKVIGDLNWIEIVSYYRFIGGNNVFVYVIGDGDKKLIVDIIDEDDNILLINKNGKPLTDSYDNVTNSKKVFQYSESLEDKEYYLGKQKFIIPTEKS